MQESAGGDVWAEFYRFSPLFTVNSRLKNAMRFTMRSEVELVNNSKRAAIAQDSHAIINADREKHHVTEYGL